MENWGCEYLDIINIQEFKQFKHSKKYYDIPIKIIDKMIDKHIHSETRINDAVYIAQLREDIARNGLLIPGQITIGTNGVALSDGNHRYCACLDLGYETFRVKIVRSNNPIKVNGIKNADLILELLEYLYD